MRKKLAVLISGRGSNMEAIYNATRTQGYPAEICVVISDNEDAGGLEFARSNEITAYAFERKAFTDRNTHEEAICEAIDRSGADIVCLAGFMRILSKSFVERYEGRLLNIHPSLLPAYKGLDTHSRVLEDGAKIHGCTVHFVNSEMDGGAIIAQAAVPVLTVDSEDTLSGRVLRCEHKLYSQVISLLANDQICLVDGIVKFEDFPQIDGNDSLFSIDTMQ